ncbi:MAG: prephenate dehydrogenase/arogenate dehydrogenase family protein [Candidatus Amulumruptor caecigallinarius]|nr:prephenate dehydrogenase/arogenate dehydrogenase family protein [Candidatus Amulumruptor caecigallinarius]MCM1396840.1 prephenate dehydrogenase/arogenate dehydrogenase family protein [Candidatus Amulumruptor caecigallinarius]MCM1454216.1 prephenate dehydrogenase/arogenate dehydrogenase family protein [bacterium]
MKILILGAGKMGTFFADLLSRDHSVAVYDPDPERLRFTFGVQRFADLDEIDAFAPDLVINAATVKYTLEAFRQVLPHLPSGAILSDIASVKTGLPEFYAECGHPFVSTHPMFGPTFASLSNLADENAIIIKEGDHLGRVFFRDIYQRLKLHIEEYTFAEHDETIAYSLSIPFASTLVFGSIMKHQSAPGTTFKRHLAIARGLMSEDDFLLSEILFNPNTPDQLRRISERLDRLRTIVEKHDSRAMQEYLNSVRENLK